MCDVGTRSAGTLPNLNIEAKPVLQSGKAKLNSIINYHKNQF